MRRALHLLLLLSAFPILAADITVGFETGHDDIRYHFDNRSNWDTPFLVPHFFEQQYSSGKNLLVLRARGASWDFEIGVTPVQRARGSDYDTFFQPDGDIVVHGTSTDVDARSWRVLYDYRIAGPWRAGYGYQRDHMKFPDSISTTTHTRPPSSVSSLSTTRESTASDILDIRVGYSRTRMLNAAWELSGEVSVAPLTFARLTTYLPDKYDQPVKFTAVSYSATGRTTATWRSGRASVVLGARLGGSRAYRKSRSLQRETAAISIAVGYAVGSSQN